MFGIGRRKTWKDRIGGIADHSSDIADAAKQVASASTEVSSLVQKELRSAKEEILSELKKAPVGIGMMSATPILAMLAITLLSFAAGFGLAEKMALGYAFSIVGGIYLLAAIIMFAIGKNKVSSMNLLPTRTIESAKKDAKNLVAQS